VPETAPRCAGGTRGRPCQRDPVNAGPDHQDLCPLHLRQRHPRVAAAWKRTADQVTDVADVAPAEPEPEPAAEQPVPPVGRLLGKTEPRLFTEPLRPLDRTSTWGYAVIDFAQTIGAPLLPWQEWVVIHALELAPGCTTDQAGWRFRFRTILVMVARQSGKSHLSRIIQLFKAFVLRMALCVNTAQDLTIALRLLEKTNDLVSGCPALASQRVQFRRGNGKESLVLSGSREIITRAATEDAARSLTVDHLTIDELRTHVSWGPWSALSKTLNAVANGQGWLFSNAGGEEAVVLNQLRANALSGKTPSLFLAEYSAPDGCALDDREGWAQANPALGFTISEDAIQSALDTDPPAIFRTEVLCQAVASLDGAIDLAAWRDHGDAVGNGVAAAERRVLCLDVSPVDGSVILLGGAPMPDGRTRVQVLKTWKDIMAALADLPDIDAALKPERFGWYPSGPAAAMASALRSSLFTRRRGFEVVELTGSDVIELCQEFAALVMAGQVVHSGDKILDGHIAGAKRWRTGDGWRFVRRGDQGSVHGAYAAAGAVRLARNLPPPRQRVKLVV
jgi:hypothetical protein